MAANQPDVLVGLAPADADRLLALGTRMRVAGGAELFRLGAPAESIFIVERGRISLTLPMQICGREQDVLIEERQPGQTVGWSALIPPHRFTLRATAPLDSDVIALGRTALLDHFAALPDIGYVVTRNVAEIVGQRLQVLQAMWLREMQRVVDWRTMPQRASR